MRNAALNPQFKGGQPEIEILAGSQFVLSPLGSWETVFGRAALICSTSPVVFQHLVARTHDWTMHYALCTMH